MKTLNLNLARLFAIAIVLVSVNVCGGKKLPSSSSAISNLYSNPELRGGYVEGDLKLTQDQKSMLFAKSVDRSGLVNKRYRWPASLVWFKFANDIGKFNHIESIIIFVY